MLLAFSAIPSISEIGTNPSGSKSKKEKKEMSSKTIPVPASPSESDFDSDSNESPVLFVPSYVPPHRRNNVCLNSKTSSNNGSADGSAHFINDSSHHGSLNTFRGSPPVNAHRSQSNVRTESSFQADSTGSVGQPSCVDSSRNQSEELVQPQPRKSGRNRQAPQRYGEWILNQMFVDQPDDREYFI